MILTDTQAILFGIKCWWSEEDARILKRGLLLPVSLFLPSIGHDSDGFLSGLLSVTDSLLLCFLRWMTAFS